MELPFSDAWNLVAITDEGESASLIPCCCPLRRVRQLPLGFIDCRFEDLQMSMRPTSGPIDHLDHAVHQRAWLWTQMGDRETV